jgi:sulfur relay (sulfurtransferase) DsrC/TusE family protein
MNDTETTKNDGEMPIYDAVKNLSMEDLEQTVRKNAGDRDFPLNDEHLEVIYSLVEHYKRDCATRDCLAAHEHMRFLEEAFEPKGGGKYLYMLFDALADTRGVLMPIHELAGLPPLHLETDKGYGTAY